MKVYVGSNPASALAASAMIYFHFSCSLHCGICHVSFHVAWYWKPPSTRPMWGVTTHISAPNRNTYWKTALKKNTDNRSLTPSLLRILSVLHQTVRVFARFWTTAGHSSSATDITIPWYLKDVTISRGRP